MHSGGTVCMARARVVWLWSWLLPRWLSSLMRGRHGSGPTAMRVRLRLFVQPDTSHCQWGGNVLWCNAKAFATALYYFPPSSSTRGRPSTLASLTHLSHNQIDRQHRQPDQMHARARVRAPVQCLLSELVQCSCIVCRLHFSRAAESRPGMQVGHVNWPPKRRKRINARPSPHSDI